MKRGGARLFLASSLCALTQAALSHETVSYRYDSLGRLVRVDRTGTVNNGVSASYSYDPADNRTHVTSTAGASSPPPSSPPPSSPPPSSPPPSSPPPGPPPAFTVTANAVNEGSKLVFTISKSNLTAGTFSVSFATSNGTATAYSDYYPASGTLTFTTEHSQAVSVSTIVDSAAEPAETVIMTLSNPTGGATVHPTAGQATATINANASNNPPTAVNDTASIARCTTGSFNVIANDTDPEGDLPLRLTAVGGSALQLGYVSVGSNTEVAWAKASQAGTYFVDYTVTDSRNARSTGRLTVTVTGTGTGACS